MWAATLCTQGWGNWLDWTLGVSLQGGSSWDRGWVQEKTVGEEKEPEGIRERDGAERRGRGSGGWMRCNPAAGWHHPALQPVTSTLAPGMGVVVGNSQFSHTQWKH